MLNFFPKATQLPVIFDCVQGAQFKVLRYFWQVIVLGYIDSWLINGCKSQYEDFQPAASLTDFGPHTLS